MKKKKNNNAVESQEVVKTESKPKKPIYKKWWFWVLILIILIAIFGSSSGDDEEDSEAADSAVTESSDTETESHIYGNAEIIDVMNGSGDSVVGQYSLITADSSDISLEVLEDWYFNYIKVTDYNWYVILYSDMTDNSGIYGISGFIEIGVLFEEDEYGVYTIADSSTATAYCYPADDSTLEMYYYEEEEETGSSEEESTEESSSEIVAILEQLGTFEETTVTGSGDDVIDLPVTGIPIIMDITYSGSSNFIIYTVDSEGETVDLLVNEIGAYTGTQTDYLDFADVTMLSIQSSGDWSITFKPMASMPELVSGAENSGDGVYYISTDSLTKLTITNSGDGNFIIRGIGLSSSSLLVNEIGDYEGTVVWTEEESFLIVTSEGNWTVSW